MHVCVCARTVTDAAVTSVCEPRCEDVSFFIISSFLPVVATVWGRRMRYFSGRQYLRTCISPDNIAAMFSAQIIESFCGFSFFRRRQRKCMRPRLWGIERRLSLTETRYILRKMPFSHLTICLTVVVRTATSNKNHPALKKKPHFARDWHVLVDELAQSDLVFT